MLILKGNKRCRIGGALLRVRRAPWRDLLRRAIGEREHTFFLPKKTVRTRWAFLIAFDLPLLAIPAPKPGLFMRPLGKIASVCGGVRIAVRAGELLRTSFACDRHHCIISFGVWYRELEEGEAALSLPRGENAGSSRRSGVVKKSEPHQRTRTVSRWRLTWACKL